MYRTRRPASHTLPRNFTFHYTDVPKTPEPPETQQSHDGSPPAPPSPPRQTYRLRRRRGARQLSSDYLTNSNPGDVPIPTIEISDGTLGGLSQVQLMGTARLAGLGPRRRSMPRTPSAQVIEVLREQWERERESPMEQDEIDEEKTRRGESISRPSTACSGFSDSSASSSVESFPSLGGGSFTSPDSENLEPTQQKNQTQLRSNSLAPPLDDHKKTTEMSKRPKPKWTEDMDKHLWMTYICYMQDATKTPFRMAPGAPPPLGICSRVVREAKRSWKGGRTSITNEKLNPWVSVVVRGDSPDTIKPVESGSTTPTGSRRHKHIVAWPRSDAATRKRFRELCKRHSGHSAGYSRMLHTKTPAAPTFASLMSSSPPPAVPSLNVKGPDVGFSTRDMAVSLFSSTSDAVTALNQLTSEPMAPTSATGGAGITRLTSTHQKSHSLHLGDSRWHVLASPFQPRSSRISGICDRSSPVNSLETPMARPLGGLASPMQITSPTNAHGNTHDDGIKSFPAMMQPHNNGDYLPGISARRVRSRGFSLGDVSHSSRRLTQLFDPTPPSFSTLLNNSHTAANLSSHNLLPPQSNIGNSDLLLASGIKRLGSPFAEQPRGPHHFHTFPRNLSLHSLEVPLESQEEQRQSGL